MAKKVFRILFMLLIAVFGIYLAIQFIIIFHRGYKTETAIAYTMADSISLQGVVSFDTVRVDGSGDLGYLVSDGERVTNGTVLAECYTDDSQGLLRERLDRLGRTIDLLSKSQNSSGSDLSLLTSQTSYIKDTVGVLPNILNTLYIIVVAMVIVLPLGVGAAIYLTEYAANKRVVAAIEYAAETLSGIPSIIYGLVGQMFFCQFLGMKKSLIAGAMTLVIMNLPTIMRTTQESLKTVPQSYREGAFGLGAGKWRVIRTVVLPGCVDGVITGCILAVGRILGETAALLYTAGFAHTLYSTLRETLQSSGATLSVALYVYAKEQGEFDVAFAIAAILMVLALIIDVAAALVGKYFQRRKSI